MSYTLIATLGQSPGAVTGLYHALREDERELDIERLCILKTADNDVEEAFVLICDHFKRAAPHLKIDHYTLDEIEHTKTASFQKMITDSIQRYEKLGSIVAGVGAGRTSMGVMLGITAQLFPQVTHIYHLWVSPRIEKHGNIDFILKERLEEYDPDLYNEILHPQKNQRQLIPLYSYVPILKSLSLIELRERIEQTPTLALEDKDAVNGLLDTLPRRLNVSQARDFSDVLKGVQAGSLLDTEKLVTVLDEAGITYAARHVRNLEMISQNGKSPQEQLDEWSAAVVRDGQYWARDFLEAVRAFREDEVLYTAAIQSPGKFLTAALQVLALHFQIADRQMLRVL